MCTVNPVFLVLAVLFIESRATSVTQTGCVKNSEDKFQYFSENERIKLREKARRMFYFGYDNYMKFAFPKDELDPIHCSGRGPDYENPWVLLLCTFEFKFSS